MECPFFGNYWNLPRRPPYVPSTTKIPAQWTPVAPKAVPIPVRSVGSGKSRAEWATKIQKVFRGFLVRRSVKKVVAIEREVNEVERRIASEETVVLIWSEPKERLRLGEILMRLLLRLDSVKGVDSGIRIFRKAVIKKAIALQEKVDSIVAADEGTDVVDKTLEVGSAECGSEGVDPSLEIYASGARESGVEESLEIEDRIPEHEDERSASDIANSESANGCDCDKRAIECADGCNELENVDGVASRLRSIEIEGSIIEESTQCRKGIFV